MLRVILCLALCFCAVPAFGEEAETFAPIPLDRGEASPNDGILIDEATAAELAVLRASNARLSSELRLRLELWNAQKQIYEENLTNLQGRVNLFIEEFSKEASWWEVWGGPVLALSGFLVGTCAAILTAWALSSVVTSP